MPNRTRTLTTRVTAEAGEWVDGVCKEYDVDPSTLLRCALSVASEGAALATLYSKLKLVAELG